MSQNPSRAFGYGRVSKVIKLQQQTAAEAKANDPMSLRVQHEAVYKYYQWRLMPRGIEWAGWFQDPAVSGKTFFKQREAGGRLNQLLASGDHVLIAKTDRAFRSFYDQVTVMHNWMGRGIIIHSIDMGIDTSTPVGEAMMEISAVFAKLELSRISERHRESKRLRKILGKQLNFTAGYGFSWKGPPGNKRRVPNVEEQRVMAEIVMMRDAGMAGHAIWLQFKRERRMYQNHKDGRYYEWNLRRIYRLEEAMRKMMAERNITDPTLCFSGVGQGSADGSGVTPSPLTTPGPSSTSA